MKARAASALGVVLTLILVPVVIAGIVVTSTSTPTLLTRAPVVQIIVPGETNCDITVNPAQTGAVMRVAVTSIPATHGSCPTFDNPGGSNHRLRIRCDPDADNLSRVTSLEIKTGSTSGTTHVKIENGVMTQTALAGSVRLATREHVSIREQTGSGPEVVLACEAQLWPESGAESVHALYPLTFRLRAT